MSEAPTMPNDPGLKTKEWHKIRAFWLTGGGRTAPCARCGGEIDRRRGARGPWSLDVGHIVSRYEARRLGWSEDKIHAQENTQAEHRRCNRAAGAAITNAIREASKNTKPQVRHVSRAW